MSEARENIYGNQDVLDPVIQLGYVNHVHEIHIPLAIYARYYDAGPDIFASGTSG